MLSGLQLGHFLQNKAHTNDCNCKENSAAILLHYSGKMLTL